MGHFGVPLITVGGTPGPFSDFELLSYGMGWWCGTAVLGVLEA